MSESREIIFRRLSAEDFAEATEVLACAFMDDPLLNYPLGRSGARPPLFNMMSLGFSRLLTPFMGEVEAIGYSMQFVLQYKLHKLLRHPY